MHHHGSHVEVDVFGRVQPAGDVDVARLFVERELTQVYLARRAELEAGQPVDVAIREDLDAEMVRDQSEIGTAVHPTNTNEPVAESLVHALPYLLFASPAENLTTGSE